MKPNTNITIRIPKTTADTSFKLYEMQKDKSGENIGWQERSEQVKYLQNKEKFEVKVTQPLLTCNLDYLPFGLGNVTRAKTPFIKSRVIKKGKAYISGDQSVLKLKRYKPRKFKTL